ncbi:MAG: DUF2203 domain-containing protein [Longimicrobiales bacterium]
MTHAAWRRRRASIVATSPSMTSSSARISASDTRARWPRATCTSAACSRADLEDLGCYFKGLQEGLVDWYSLYAGRSVFLCWKLGEPEIAWRHPIDAGFAGRQPILDSQRGAFRRDES